MSQVKSYQSSPLVRRSLRNATYALFATLALSAFATPSSAFTPEWYLGVSGGVSKLTPDTDGSIYRLDEDISPGVGLFLGRDFSERASFELGYSQLGEAGLVARADASSSETIAYNAISASVLFYVIGDREDIAAREALATYVRLGVSSIGNESDINLDQEDNTSLVAGLGVERLMGGAFGGRWGLRAELATLDGDVQTATVSVYLRPFAAKLPAKSNSTRSTPEPVPVPVPVPAPELDPTPAPSPETLPKVDLWDEPESPAAEVEVESEVEPEPEVECAQPVSGEPVDAAGCALFTGTIVTDGFDSSGSELIPEGRRALDQIAVLMRKHPDVIIELQSHTRSFGDAATTRAIARGRVVSAARHLSARGVPVARLRARAFGSSQPPANPAVPEDRLELVVLP